MCAKPLIGISSDRRILDPHPFHMVGEKYVTAIRDGANALPLLIPVLGEDPNPDDILSSIDGLFLTGSPSNIEPHHYEGDNSRDGTWHDPERDATTLPLARRALETGVPLLAVCRGFQELNVVLGGTLHQHVHEIEGYHYHKEDPADPLDVQYGPSHPVTLMEGGMLHRLAGSGNQIVNSLHGQGIAKLADGVTVEAVADDGLIEGFQVDAAHGFALAVQWHPEWKVTENEFSMAIFRAFGDACREHRKRRNGDDA